MLKQRLQWCWQTELVAEVKCLTEDVCLQQQYYYYKYLDYYYY